MICDYGYEHNRTNFFISSDLSEKTRLMKEFMPLNLLRGDVANNYLYQLSH